ncbi:MAG: hypothetical protein RTV41_12050 [Candidatus Thorarchaeota archaeon]
MSRSSRSSIREMVPDVPNEDFFKGMIDLVQDWNAITSKEI